MIPERIPGEIPEKKRIKIEQRKVEATMKEAMRERLKLHAKATRLQDWKLKEEAPEVRDHDEFNPSSNDLASLGLSILSELQKQKEEDFFSLFCLSIACKLRALPQSTSESLTVKILELVNSANTPVMDNEYVYFKATQIFDVIL